MTTTATTATDTPTPPALEGSPGSNKIAVPQPPKMIPRPSLGQRPTVLEVLERWHNEHHRFAFDVCTEQPCRDARDARPDCAHRPGGEW